MMPSGEMGLSFHDRALVRYRYPAVMARQVMEDALSFFYLSEPNLMHEEKQFREDVWRFHGATESIESVRCANVSNPDLAPAIDAELKRRKELLEKHSRLSAIEGGRRRAYSSGSRESRFTRSRNPRTAWYPDGSLRLRP